MYTCCDVITSIFFLHPFQIVIHVGELRVDIGVAKIDGRTRRLLVTHYTETLIVLHIRDIALFFKRTTFVYATIHVFYVAEYFEFSRLFTALYGLAGHERLTNA